jgi:hypothetical protein
MDSRGHFETPFVNEKHIPAMLGMFCSSKRVLK